MLWFNKPSDLTSPLDDNLYKVVLSLDALNPVLSSHVVARSQRLESLTMTADQKSLYVVGDYVVRDDSRIKSLGYSRIHFRAELTVRGQEGNDVILDVARIRLFDGEHRRLDLLRLATKIVPRLRRSIIKSFTVHIPHIMTPRSNFSQVAFHTNYFLAKVPSLYGSLGDIKILSATPQSENRVFFYVHSNLILINLVHYFGPQYLALEEIQIDQETQKMLWQEPDGG